MTVQQLRETLLHFQNDMEVKIKYYQDNEKPYLSEMRENIEQININVKSNSIELTYLALKDIAGIFKE